MSDLIIRHASIDDLPSLLKFEQSIIAYERKFDPTLKPDPISYYDLEALISDERAAVVVGEVNGELIASGHARIFQSKAYVINTEYAHLGFMYVDPKFRGKGVNGKVIDALKNWAVNNGLNEMQLTVYSDNDGAIKAYEKAGFNKHIIEMRIDLD